MTDIRRALVRKFGPLPAWAWAGILGGALFLYRRSADLRAGVPASGGSATAPGISDETGERRDPVTLDPGQGVYDPETGKLTGVAAEQQPKDDVVPQLPIVLQPGESVYDPNTGGFITGRAAANDDDGAPSPVTAAGKPTKAKNPARTILKASPKHNGQLSVFHRYKEKGKVITRYVRPASKAATKRAQKQKTQHKGGTKVSHPSTHKSKPRGSGKVMTSPLHTKSPQAAPKQVHSRTPAASSPTGSRHRQQTPAPRHEPIRQRPAAPKVVSHGQKVQPHPARAAAAPVQHAPVHQPPARHTPPPPKKRKR